jgi:hypothetical protein
LFTLRPNSNKITTGIFLHGTSIQPETIGELVARIKNGENMENITALKK